MADAFLDMCTRTYPHSPHKWMLARRVRQCPGRPEPKPKTEPAPPQSPQPGVLFVSEYMVDALPEGDDNWGTWHLQVSYRGDGLWAVVRGAMVLTKDGEAEYEPSPSNRDDGFKARTRFPLNQALALATKLLPEMRVNGYTLADWNAKHS